MPESNASDTEATGEDRELTQSELIDRGGELHVFPPRRGSAEEDKGKGPDRSQKAAGLPGQPALPRYECHKRIWALKIKSVWVRQVPWKLHPKQILLLFAEEGYLPRLMSAEWVERHKPKAGGYWVLDEDTGESFVPPEVFETGYTLME